MEPLDYSELVFEPNPMAIFVDYGVGVLIKHDFVPHDKCYYILDKYNRNIDDTGLSDIMWDEFGSDTGIEYCFLWARDKVTNKYYYLGRYDL